MPEPLSRPSAPGTEPGLPSEAWGRLEGLLERFEAAWRRDSSGPDLADYLADARAERLALLRALALVDLEHRLRAGQPARVEDYLGRFPELADDPAVVDLVAAEFVLRERRGDGPRLEDFQALFPSFAGVLPERVAARRGWGLIQKTLSIPPGGRASEAVTLEPPPGTAGDTPPQKSFGVRDTPGARIFSADGGSPGSATPAVPGYELLGRLGTGGMGVVYKACQVALGRVVALKMIRHAEHAGPEDLERFRAEARAVGRLQHPNIVQIYEIGEAGGLPYFSLEYCPGGSLAQKLAGTPLPPRVAAELVETLARAVQAAHQQHLVHRDLKPANVLLSADGQPKVTDFGLVKRLGEVGQTASGAIMGTASYMAPEQAQGKGKEVGSAADVYALGAILYECLTGRPPFRGATEVDTLMQVVTDEPVPVRLLQPGVPRDLETICHKCLEKAPARRYTTAQALAEDLGRFRAGELILARSINLVGRLQSTLGRSQYDIAYRSFGTMFLVFALVMLLTEGLANLLLLSRQPIVLVGLSHLPELVLLGVFSWRCRWSVHRSAVLADRLMITVWVGYLITLLALAAYARSVSGWNTEVDLGMYPIISAVTGLSFLILGSCYWGWCYVFGAAFYGLTLLMMCETDWAPLEFGLLWAVVLTIIGIRLRRLPTPVS